MKVLSLGWGVQSFTILCMVVEKEIELDYAIHADTGFESDWTYELAKKMIPYFISKGIKVITVSDKNAQNRFMNSRQVFIPAHTSNSGMLMRTCTDRWKIAPIRRKIQKLRKEKEHVELLMGITTDEWQRVKPSRVKYITNVYPLIERNMSRNDCIHWLKKHHYDIPNKSSCYFCPYHSSEAWKKIKSSKDWNRAVKIDQLIRNKMEGCRLYVNANKCPLENMPDQLSLGIENEECAGYCFV